MGQPLAFGDKDGLTQERRVEYEAKKTDVIRLAVFVFGAGPDAYIGREDRHRAVGGCKRRLGGCKRRLGG
jgi:hypothetical protein